MYCRGDANAVVQAWMIGSGIRIETGMNVRRHALDRPLARDRIDTS
jgi:hypothetical protein